MTNKYSSSVKIVSAFTVMLISINIAAAFDSQPVEESPVFSDINLGHQHYVAIKYLKENGLIHGYEDGSYKPLNEINRAESLKILTGALAASSDENNTTDINFSNAPKDELPPINDDSIIGPDQNTNSAEQTEPASSEFNFPDVPKDAWFYEYIRTAWENGVVEGYPNGNFHPENTINRAESLKISLLLEGEEIPTNITEPPYTDVPVDAWFAPYAQVSAERSLIIRDRANEALLPAQNLNRGDFADLVYRIIKSQNNSRFAVTTWYGRQDVNWGTASGEKFDTNLPTAAHKNLPFGTMIKVTNLANGKIIEVRINDRGPYAKGMDLDLTSSAFEAIASLGAGVIVTEYEIISSNDLNTTTNEETTTEVQYGF